MLEPNTLAPFAGSQATCSRGPAASLEELQADLRRRWQCGERACVEGCLEREPGLRSRPEVVLDLIYHEVLLREEAGEAPHREEYEQRFPGLHADLCRLFEVHGALGPGGATDGPAAAGWAGPGYEILSEVGRGAMGVVYRARQKSLGRVVALKMILDGPHAGPRDLARFRAEAAAVARLQHPNIVQIFEVGEQDGRPYLALEFIDGDRLDRKLRGGPLPPRAAAELAETLARAVHYAHERGVVHRDLKPANILLQTTEHTENTEPRQQNTSLNSSLSASVCSVCSVVKITDFGLAKRLDDDSGRTESGAILGTPSYMAPEQARGRADLVGPAADVYALGAILYACLTGRPPFQGATPLDTLEQVRRREPVAPRRLRAHVPADLETICLKCLHKQAGRRYASARELADDLRRFRAGRPVVARPVGRAERALKWARRHPAAAALAGVTALAVLSVAGLLGWHSGDLRRRLASTRDEVHRLRDERELSERERRAAELREELRRLLAQGEAAVRRGDWPAARLRLGPVWDRVKSEPGLEDVREAARRGLAEAERGEEARRQADAALGRFRQHRDETLFHAALVPGLNRATRREATRGAARDGLAVFGVAADAGAPPPLGGAFTEKEKQEILQGCYELLAALSEAEAHPPPGGRDGGQAVRALALLDRAAELRPPTQAHHLLRARYLALGGEGGAAEREHERAGALTPGPADHFLLGKACYGRGELDRAAGSFEEVLKAQPDHFWAQFYLAGCCLRAKPRRPVQAVGRLSLCVAQRPDSPWAYVARGHLYVTVQNFDRADQDFHQALRGAPNELTRYVIHLNLGLLRREQQRYAEAAEELRRALRCRPGGVEASALLADVRRPPGGPSAGAAGGGSSGIGEGRGTARRRPAPVRPGGPASGPVAVPRQPQGPRRRQGGCR
jgi:tetratricopeptide (TPR) repeat protein